MPTSFGATTHIALLSLVVSVLFAVVGMSALANEKPGVVGKAVAATHDHAQALRSDSLGTTNNVHAAGTILLAGQPSADDLALAKKAGVRTVINLRSRGEISWNEKAIVERLGMKFIDLGFRAPDDLTDEVFDESRQALNKANKDNGVLLHCASANRVGALWLAFRVLDGKKTIAEAKTEAAAVGLKTEAYQAKALDYIKRHQKN